MIELDNKELFNNKRIIENEKKIKIYGKYLFINSDIAYILQITLILQS